MKNVVVKKNVWFSDEDDTLQFPEDWTINVFGTQYLPALSDTEINQRLDEPIDSLRLSLMAIGRKSAIILIDDISRPTPVTKLLSNVIARLSQAGVPANGIKVLIAGGTHRQANNEEILMKAGLGIPKEVDVLTHDCKSGCVWIGKTSLGTPIFINKNVMDSDIKIGIGSVYPHPIAGFSGGNKILALGAAGLETIRVLHDLRRGSNLRTGEIDHPFRNEINEIGEIVGMNFCINVTLNQSREISGIFAGHPEKAFSKAVSFVKKNYSVQMDPKADIVVIDMYPFDMDFQFAFDRGLWPLEYSPKTTTKIILANCIKGIGSHELFPVSNPMLVRIKRRIMHFKVGDIFNIFDRIRSIRKIIWRRNLNTYVVTPYISNTEIKKVLPKSKIVNDWESMLQVVTEKYKGKSNICVAFYLTAPLMLHLEKDTSDE
jgi:nickel-dependent lactate racemase